MSDTAPPKRPVRALVIGAGVTSQLIHLPILAKLQSEGMIELILVCDLDDGRARSAQTKFGFQDRCGDGIAAVNRGDIDAVYVFGMAQMHKVFGAEALRAGKHLFVEKPVAPSWSDAQELADLAQNAGLIAAGGHNRRFYKSLDAARMRAGKGGFRYAEATFHKPEFGRPPPFGARTWLSANGIHALDALIFMMGSFPEYMTSFAREQAFSAVMQWSDGAQGVFVCNNNAGERLERYAFHAPGTTFTIDEDGLAIASQGMVSKLGLSPQGDGFEAEHRSFLAAIETGIEPANSIASLVPSLFLSERIEEGFSGKIEFPKTRRQPVVATGASRTILVDRIDRLTGALSDLSVHCRLISVADVSMSGHPRPDVEGAILGGGAPPFSQATLDKLPNLRVVGVAALSLAAYEPVVLLTRGISLVNATETYAESVAEFALGLAILGRRRAFLSHELMRRGGWGVGGSSSRLRQHLQTTGLPLARTLRLDAPLRALWRRTVRQPGNGAALAPRMLRGATAGLIGWGANARALATRLAAAGATVLVYSEHAADDEIIDARRSTLAEVLAADIVSLHRGLTPATRHFLGAGELSQLRPGAVLINVARGALMDPDALLQRLRRGDIFACLDTFETEPPSRGHALRRLPNVFLTSHIAGGSGDMHAAAAKEVVAKVNRFLDGTKVDAVSETRLRTMT
jgi:phosphoglycerate dehydrogenase-like enzyme/predicted dehydrogenase